MHFFSGLRLILHDEIMLCHMCFLSSFKLSGQEEDFLTEFKEMFELLTCSSDFLNSICFFLSNDPPVKPKEKYFHYYSNALIIDRINLIN